MSFFADDLALDTQLNNLKIQALLEDDLVIVTHVIKLNI